MNTLRSLREAHQFTQEYVAEAIGVSRITYVRYENNSRQIKTPELKKLAALYRITTDQLISDVIEQDIRNIDDPHGHAGNEAVREDIMRLSKELTDLSAEEVQFLRDVVQAIKERHEAQSAHPRQE